MGWTNHCRGLAEVATFGCSMGAFHAANFALKRADLFPLALCFSGNDDPASWNGWGERGTAVTSSITRPTTSGTCTARISTGCAARLSLLLVCGQGWTEDTTGALSSPGSSPQCSPTGRSGTNLIYGATTCRTTGRPGVPSSPTTCRDSADDLLVQPVRSPVPRTPYPVPRTPYPVPRTPYPVPRTRRPSTIGSSPTCTASSACGSATRVPACVPPDRPPDTA